MTVYIVLCKSDRFSAHFIGVFADEVEANRVKENVEGAFPKYYFPSFECYIKTVELMP